MIIMERIAVHCCLVGDLLPILRIYGFLLRFYGFSVISEGGDRRIPFHLHEKRTDNILLYSKKTSFPRTRE